MKRTAETQLTKDRDDDGDEIQEIEQPSSDFQKADDSALVKRQIRGLPKRALAGTTAKAASFNGFAAPPAPAANADKEAPGPQKFGGFTGFGVGSSASGSFTFNLQPKPAQSPTSGSGAPNNLSSFTPSPPKPNVQEEGGATALKYYKSLRGLNVSFLSAISKTMDQDPFADMAGLLESYKTLRMTVQSEFDKTSKAVSNSGSCSTSGPSFTTTSTPANTSVSMPKPPVISLNTAAPAPPVKPPSTNGSPLLFGAPKPGGFSPSAPVSSLSTASSPFALVPKENDSSMTSLSPAFSFPKSLSGPPPSKPQEPSVSKPLDLPFAVSTAKTPSSNPPEKGPEASTVTPTPLPPGPVTSTTSIPNIFAFPKTSTSSNTDAKPTSFFGTSGSIFGSSSVSTAFESGAKAGNETAKQSGNSLFGSSVAKNIFGAESSPPVFGSSSPPKSNVFSFGKPAGSIGNPVGFGFGALPSKDDGDGSAGSSKPPTGLGADKLSEGSFSPAPTEGSGTSTPHLEGSEEVAASTEDNAAKQATVNYDAEGPGEEDEETVHAVRSKLFKLVKTEEKDEWKDLGIGILRLKRHKETKARRVLMRNSSTGRIQLNFRFYSAFKVSLAKTVISFVAPEEGIPAFYKMRVKTEEQASELKAVIDQEMAASLASS